MNAPAAAGPASSVAADLARWGPGRQTDAPSLAAAREYCRRLATTHYENFSVLTWLLPRKLRPHIASVYAFCRWADDLGDEIGDSARALELLAWWREGLERCFAGAAVHPVYVALRASLEACRLSQQPFQDLISAFEQDQRVCTYPDFDALRDYCRRSANPVGRIVLELLGRSEPRLISWSDSICTGLQLANFWQDVARDYALGRVYLPQADLATFGVTAEMLAEQRSTPEFTRLLAFEVDRARGLLRAGAPLPGAFSGRLRLMLELFLQGGLRICQEIESIGWRVWEQRPVVSSAAKRQLIWSSLLRTVGPPWWRGIRPGSAG